MLHGSFTSFCLQSITCTPRKSHIGKLFIVITFTIIRDIKPENILLEHSDLERLDIKMTDFGFACFFNPQEGLSDVLGSPLYMAPEIILEKKYDQRVDIWSLGVIAYILLSGRPPFKGRSKQDIFKSILDDPLDFKNSSVWQKVSLEAREFIKLALEKDFLKRPSAAFLLEHDWLRKQIKEKLVHSSTSLDVGSNLREFSVRVYHFNSFSILESLSILEWGCLFPCEP